MFTSNYGEPKTKWVAYDNGSYEPVDRKGDLRYKSRSRNEPDWWVEDKSPDWRPEKYAKTKRGQKAKQELGYTSSTEATNKTSIEIANPMRPTFIQEDTDHNAPSLPKTAWSLSKQYPSLIGGGFDEKIAGMVKQNVSQQTVSEQDKVQQDVVRQNVARQTQQDTPQKQSAMTQPQHKNTGHATAQLGGAEDGKITIVREGQDSAKGNTGTARNFTQDVAALKEAEAKQQSQNSTASARDLKVKEQRLQEKIDKQRSGWGKVGDGFVKLGQTAPKGIKDALIGGWNAVNSEEMKKGAEFGFRAAGEVVKESAKMATEDAIKSFVGAKFPKSLAESIMFTKVTQGEQLHKALFAEGYREKALSLAEKINAIEKDIYGDKKIKDRE